MHALGGKCFLRRDGEADLRAGGDQDALHFPHRLGDNITASQCFLA